MLLSSPQSGTGGRRGDSEMMGHLEKPRPTKVAGNVKGPKGYSILTVSSVQKNGTFSSAGDLSGTPRENGSKKAKVQFDGLTDATTFPLLSEKSNYAAALMPEVLNGNDTGEKSKTFSKLHLRFPILSPTREESMVLTRMKTMQRATKLAQSDPNLLARGTTQTGTWRKKTPESHKIELEKLEKVSPLPQKDSKPRSRLQSRGGYHSTGRSSQATQSESQESRPAMKRETTDKIIVPSKHGYHRRSNSATYKRLDSVRKSLDQLVEYQVHDFQDKTDLEDVLEEMSNVDAYDYGGRITPVPIQEGLPTLEPRSSRELPFLIDRSLYELNDDNSINMDVLYKERTVTPREEAAPSVPRAYTGKRSIDIVIPTGQMEQQESDTKPSHITKQRGRRASKDFETALKLMRDGSPENKKKEAATVGSKRKEVKPGRESRGSKLEYLTDTSVVSSNTTPKHGKSRSRDHSQSPKASRSSVDSSKLPDIDVDFMKQKLMSIEVKQKSKLENARSKEQKEKRKVELAKLLKTQPNGPRDILKSRDSGKKTNRAVSFVPESWSDKYKRRNEDEAMYWDSGEENLDDEFDI